MRDITHENRKAQTNKRGRGNTETLVLAALAWFQCQLTRIDVESDEHPILRNVQTGCALQTHNFRAPIDIEKRHLRTLRKGACMMDRSRKHPLVTSVLLGVSLAAWMSSLSGCGRAVRVATDQAEPPASAHNALDGMAKHELNRFNTEAYDALEENDFVAALTQPQSTFSIDVDTASYANVRRLLSSGTKPPAGAVRLEELINYFHYEYPEPDAEHPFSVSHEVAACPWNPEHQLLRVGLKGRAIEMDQRTPANLVFLLDVSGSMLAENKLPLVKSAMRLMIQELDADDRIAIVVYAGASGLVLDSTPVSEASEILGALEELRAGGSTNGGEGIRLAYQVAADHWIEGGINRVVLCTDGDFNVGITNQSDLVELIQAKAQSNIFLSVLGFGSGNLKDSTLEKLADQGHGNYAYIDSLMEARKVLVEQIGGTLITIAKDVKIQIDFNPRHVQAYRLLGYENRLLANQDFRDDSKDAGEIGAGHTVTAFYELVPAGSTPSSESRPSEFVRPTLISETSADTMLTVNLRYKQPEASESSEFQVRVPTEAISQTPSMDFQFATAVAAYGMLLRDSRYAGTADWDWVIDTASSNRGSDPRGLRAEFVQLAQCARRIAN